jgi:hypothetical protein
MEQWELNRIDRLEGRVDRLESKNRERATFWFNVAIYGMLTAFLVFDAVVIAIHASSS